MQAGLTIGTMVAFALKPHNSVPSKMSLAPFELAIPLLDLIDVCDPENLYAGSLR